MMKSTILQFLFLTIFSLSAHAEECMVSTDARALLKGAPGVKAEKLLADEGRYSAVLNNGDTLVAQFATCSLGTSVHYFVVKQPDDKQLNDLVSNLLSRILPSEAVVQKVLPQLKGKKAAEFSQGVVLEGMNDQHQIKVMPSTSPVFATVIQYSWIPPEH
ncbi:MAG: hypothetical protein OEZ39_08330 [Gammaproteobacteria bacterium]|nr:hypothetical protein [Gammaproteobacteria bacterium]MDH5651868.1 hypothetical protein [Gammaproteobacteria bacterium]